MESLGIEPSYPQKSPKPGKFASGRMGHGPKSTNGPKNKKSHFTVCYRFVGCQKNRIEHTKKVQLKRTFGTCVIVISDFASTKLRKKSYVGTGSFFNLHSQM